MPRRPLALTLALVAVAGCGDGETLAPVEVCAPTLPSSHWPSESGVLHLDVPPPSGPFTTPPHRVPPPVVVQNPLIIAAPRLVTVMAEGDPLQAPLEAFTDALAESAWWPTVSAEYGVGAVRPGVHVSGPPMPAGMNGNQMLSYVAAAVKAHGSDAAPDGATVFVLYLAPGTMVVDSENRLNCGCSELSGVHFAYDTTGDEIAIIQRCSASDVDSLTTTASHEILESATNPSNNEGFIEPRPFPPWSGSTWAGNELADICVLTRVHEGEWEYTRSFSNAAAVQGDDPCVPALTEPYYNVTAPEDWYAVPVSGTVTVPLTGWSTAPRDDWFVYLPPTSETRFISTIVSGESASDDGYVFYGINDGKTASLTVTATTAGSGESTIVQVFSRPSSSGNDVLHIWRVGLYVP
jgi:hypothetical protein